MLEPSAGKLARWVLRGGMLVRAFLTRQMGKNRIAGSTLFELCEILNVKIQHFYEGLERILQHDSKKCVNYIYEIDSENLEKLTTKFVKIQNKEIREHSVDMMKSLYDLDKKIANDNRKEIKD